MGEPPFVSLKLTKSAFLIVDLGVRKLCRARPRPGYLLEYNSHFLVPE